MTNKLHEELLKNLEADLKVLPDKPEESASATLKALWFSAYGEAKSAQLANKLEMPDLNSAQEQQLKALIIQRLQGTPLAHLTGRQQFLGVELLAGSGALIPRKETEILGNTALALIKDILKKQDGAVVIDVCTGAGNLPVAYAVNEPAIRVYAADLSSDAVKLAKQNVNFHDLETRVEIREGDLLSPFDNEEFYNKVDLLTCNPPYISSAKVENMHEEISHHEPKLAFDGGPFGIKILQNLINQAPRYLRKGGWLVFELGLGQGPAMMKRMKMSKHADYQEIQSVADENGEIRVVLAHV